MKPTIVIGSDHGGFRQKAMLKDWLGVEGYEVKDVGPDVEDPQDDYPLYGEAVAREVQNNDTQVGILLCRSGEGMEMVANKVKGVRAALVWKPEVAVETRRDNHANVLVLPGDFMTEDEMKDITKSFLETEPTTEERHLRRIEQMAKLENE